ncbi:hypothetical protein PF005_g11353 [Phytophthora fragariae]|uniref:Crinkler effector protein N-terminal domain-containing protein n=1 Tax=Phytophthora fragariae TaxID=53985 RepID=A0A6A3XYT1_9STRA|nr:hypothetical protein PF003_g13016 [Phytophthora fragariae]KAE9111245.1 hypothetical protein PF010_g10879 [Phytophthora fragariae]KAE9210596.1 hypothetical protein PF005_g11353 [Phytophthora fragariae]KAE9222180.1 hypothetical protein PF004_g12861 [Phytophthora fragariae]
MYQFPADELQLFLAKKDEGRGPWLTEEEVKKDVIDTTGLKLLGAARARLRRVGLSDEDVSGVDEEEEAEGRGPVNVLVVSDGSNQVAKDSPLPSAITHSENRRKRWRELNDILDKNKKAKTNGGDGTSTGYAYVRWSEVKSVLDYELYRQNRKPIPEDEFNFLWEYLTYASKAMNGYADAAKEAKRYHFIAPVLIMLCNLFDDFVLTRGKTKICIVEAKRNDFDQGKAQALVGCEAVADREGVYVVYGIVTDFIKWQLYRSGENTIVMDSCTIGGSAETIDIKTLRDTCEMIYGALSGHEQECKQEKSEVRTLLTIN